MASRSKSVAEPEITPPGEVAAQHLDLLATGKQGYKAADAALELLIAQARSKPCPTCGAHRFKNNGIVKAPDGRKFRIVDKLANRNSIPVGQNARRFELEEIQK